MKTTASIKCASSAASAAIQCRGVSVPISSVEAGCLLWMPEGVHVITPSQGGRAITVAVKVDRVSADRVQEQFEAMKAAGKNPFFSLLHDSEIAAFRPTGFEWDTRLDPTGQLRTGIWADGEYTGAGRKAVVDKDVWSFSPVFHVDRVKSDPEDPSEVVCCEDASSNMGALENDPAFGAEMAPLYGRRAKHGAAKAAKTVTISLASGRGVSNAAERGTTVQQDNKGKTMTKEERQQRVAELQASNRKLELKVAGFKQLTDDASAANRRAAETEMLANTDRIQFMEREDYFEGIQAREAARIEAKAERDVQAMVASGHIPPRDSDAISEWKAKFVKDESLFDKNIMPLIAANGNGNGNGALSGRQPNGTSVALEAAYRPGETFDYGTGKNLKDALRKYYRVIKANAGVKCASSQIGNDSSTRADAYRKKGMMALEAANFFKRELAPHFGEWESIPNVEIGKLAGVYDEIKAADYSDPNNNLGVLTGTLVLQRTLPFFAYDYPELKTMYTDFDDTPGVLNQTENTRIVLQPAVQKFDTALGADNRPKGWDVVSPGKTTNVSLTLTDYVSVPINFGNDILGSTTRRLFDEQAVLSVKALAGYFVNMVTNLFRGSQYNAYAVQSAANANPVLVPTPYVTYSKDLASFSLTDVDNIGAAFTSNKVPKSDRGILLNPQYYARLRQDPRFGFYFAAVMGMAGAAGKDFITAGKLPEQVMNFVPNEAAYMPTQVTVGADTQSNVVGFAYHKAGLILKSRLPNDFAQALGVMIPGSVTTITDPDTKISLMLVQYVNLTQGYAEWRPEVELGVAVGDSRGGLVITSA